MSKKDKLLLKLKKIPPPKDFSWDELITLMRQADFFESCNGGSHYMFEHKNGFRFRMSKTHPSGILKKYQIDAANEALVSVNYGREKI
jgi:predicted RNA binding protein YcfA (HicA-like mRNA interferase family)